jgi:hypothetical protein
LALTEIFKHALEYDEQQLQRARNRRELGNPPGKANDPLGDQISWEQLLSHVNGETVLWIISRDFDYVSISRGEVYLHPVLRRELSERGCSEVHVFSDLVAGLTHFIKSAQLPDESLPTGDTAKLLESELQSPRAMIARFWDDTLKAAQGALRKRGIRASAPFRAVSLALQQHGLISASLIPVFEELRRQRNEALHNPDFDPASEEIDFLERISSRLMNHFNSV